MTTDVLAIDEIANRYHQTGRVERWPLPVELESALEVTLRNGFAETLAQRPAEEICLRHSACSSAGMLATLRLAEQHVLPKPLAGIGIEPGAGCGVLSAVVASSPLVRTMLAVEVCTPQVELLIPKVARHVLGPQEAGKVVPIVGSFDDLKVPDGSVDFVVEYHSYHHSGDLPRTMRECARVLRRGGVALLFDRVQPNSMTDEEVEALLSYEYSRDFLMAYHYPVDLRLSRRVNGEHEYREREWAEAFSQAGLRIERRAEFYPRVSGKAAFKGLVSLLPTRLRRRLYKTENAIPKTTLQYVRQQARRLALGDRTRILGARRDSVILLRKPG